MQIISHMLRIFAFTIVFLGCYQSYYYAIANGYTKAIKNNKSSNVKTINGNKTKITNNNVRKRTKIVGVIGDRLPNDNNKHDYTHWPIYAMRYQYIDNFAKVCKDNNVTFVMLPDDLSQIDKFIDAVDAIVLTGGGDDPTKVRDKFEKGMLLGVMKQKKQVFGICRGLQMINFFLGGCGEY